MNKNPFTVSRGISADSGAVLIEGMGYLMRREHAMYPGDPKDLQYLLNLAFQVGVDHGNGSKTPASEKGAINPDHYKEGGIETIDYLRSKLTPEEFAGFLKGNALKYLSRANKKGGAQDLAKANWYTTMLTGQDPRTK